MLLEALEQLHNMAEPEAVTPGYRPGVGTAWGPQHDIFHLELQAGSPDICPNQPSWISGTDPLQPEFHRWPRYARWWSLMRCGRQQ